MFQTEIDTFRVMGRQQFKNATLFSIPRTFKIHVPCLVHTED
jgi:hypothetical protein